MQEDLSTMFSQHMRFSNDQKPGLSGAPPQTSAAEGFQEPTSGQGNPITYSISQHYHHSAHVMQNHVSPAASTAALPSATPAEEDLKEILVQSSIDPSCLLDSQLTLFKNAGGEQRSRLIELWRISPPEYASYGAQELVDELGGWQNTTLEQEEEMAKLRFQRKHTGARGAHDDVQMGKEQDDLRLSGMDYQAVEPYMTSGYEYLAQRDYNRQVQAEATTNKAYQPPGAVITGRNENDTDPVCQPREWWYRYSANQPMEHQYGMFDQMNQFRAQPQTTVGVHGQEDEEML